MIRHYSLNLILTVSIAASTLMGMQTDMSDRLPLLSKKDENQHHAANANRCSITQKIKPADNAQSLFDSRKQQRNTEANLFIAAKKVKPETMAHLLYYNTFDLQTLNTANILVTRADYSYRWHPFLKCVENFFPKSKFEADKKSCQVLLVAAQSTQKKKD